MTSSNNYAGFYVGAILRFGDIPSLRSTCLHFAVYIGDGEIVHYNKKNGSIEIIHEKIEDYTKRLRNA